MFYQSLPKNFNEKIKSISSNETKLNNLIAKSTVMDQLQVLHAGNSNSLESFEVLRMQKHSLIRSTHNRCKVAAQ